MNAVSFRPNLESQLVLRTACLATGSFAPEVPERTRGLERRCPEAFAAPKPPSRLGASIVRVP